MLPLAPVELLLLQPPNPAIDIRSKDGWKLCSGGDFKV
jgi:hypothetical protein